MNKCHDESEPLQPLTAGLETLSRAFISQVEEAGRMLTAINNLAEQCYLAARGPLQDMTVLAMMDMVKVQS